MECVVPWACPPALIAPCSSKGKRGPPPSAVQTILQIHFLQQWLTLSDPALEEALHDVPLFQEFAPLSWDQRPPDESTILRFRYLLKHHKLAEQILVVVNDRRIGKGLMLKSGAAVNATLIAAPSSTKKSIGKRDTEMHQTNKGNHRYFGTKAHIDVHAGLGLVHTV